MTPVSLSFGLRGVFLKMVVFKSYYTKNVLLCIYILEQYMHVDSFHDVDVFNCLYKICNVLII